MEKGNKWCFVECEITKCLLEVEIRVSCFKSLYEYLLSKNYRLTNDMWSCVLLMKICQPVAIISYGRDVAASLPSKTPGRIWEKHLEKSC